MTLTVGLAKKLLCLSMGELLPRSQLRQQLVARLLEEEVLSLRSRGTRQSVYCRNRAALDQYLKNHLQITDLHRYIETLSRDDLQRSDLVRIAADSKLKSIRTFKGFLLNCDQPLAASLNDVPFIIAPAPGSFTYIYDFEQFVPAADITVVGIENGENFRYLERQQGLFAFEKTLFVSRYPQSGDLIQWLQSIPNPYVHFGDFDIAGMNIYLHEFKSTLGSRAKFFVPDDLEDLFRRFGNRQLYARQLRNLPVRTSLKEPGLKRLWDLICREKKGLEQEILITQQAAR